MAENFDDFVAGWVSGSAGVVMTHPLDYLTTRLQSGTSGGALFSGASRGDQFRMVWRGLGPLLGTVPLNNALLFYGYGAGVQFAQGRQSGETVSLVPIFLGGCAGGAAQSFLQSPVELLKVRLQLAGPDSAPTAGIVAARLLQAPSGRAAALKDVLSRGLGATLLRDVVPHGVWFATYEWAKRALAQRAGSLDQGASSTAFTADAAVAAPLSVPAQLTAGATAATVAWVVGYPPDVIKTRVQMEGGAETIGGAVRSLYAEGGVGAFYRGLSLKLARAVPMSAVGFLVYEETMRALQRVRTPA